MDAGATASAASNAAASCQSVALAQAVSAQTPLHCKFHLGLSGSLFVTSHSEVVSYLVIGVA